MSIRIVCSSCRKVYNLSETMQGKTVLCRECQSPIAVPALARQGSRESGSRPPDDRIAKTTRPASAAGRTRRDEDDEPRTRPAERRPRRKEKDSSGGKNLVPIFVGVGAGVFVLLGLVIGGVAFVSLRSSSSSNQVAAASESPPALAEAKVDPAPKPAGLAAGLAKKEQTANPAGPVPAEMTPDTVRKVKQSTAYLRVSMPGGDVAQGSGFFALEQGIVITNAHVVGMLRAGSRPPRSVDVVIHSGESDEAKLAGTLLGVDRDNDLAVLRVEGDPSRLPPPLPTASAATLMETQNVYIFGFPFGAQLGKNITVSASTISSLRRDNGVLKQVQVNGGMSPGNSGGPVTDSRGMVIGVSVAGISGTQINFAVPADFIQPLVERSKSNPLDLTKPLPGPLAKNDDPPAGGPAMGAGLESDLAALKGTWHSEAVTADGGGAAANLRFSISPQPGSRGGRIQLEIIARQGGQGNRTRMNYAFTLEQAKSGERLLVTTIKQARGTVRGMVFIYRVEGDRMTLSGAIAAARVVYSLKNVALRRTSAEPEAVAEANPANPGGPMPAGGGEAKASPDALKFSGDVFSFVGEAVRDKRLTDVDIRGFTLSKVTYRDVCEEGGVLIGFQFGLGRFVNNVILQSWRPIYRTKKGERFGKWQGPPVAAPITIKAKRDYVVSGLLVKASLKLDALTVTFAKLGKTGLDLNDTYNSPPIGGNGGGNLATVGGKGALFVGVTGHLANDGSPSSLGLVAVLPKD